MILALPPASMAQGTGTISGAVTDSTSAVLPGATVVVKNTETGQAREVVTDVRTNFGIPSQSLFAANGTRLADAGRVTTLASAPRQAQIGVKFVW
jgi:hypothetical protein